MLTGRFYEKASGLATGPKDDLRELQRIYFPRFAGASLIDPLRPFMGTTNYNWRSYVVPDTGNETIPARQQFEDQMSVVPGSFLLMVGADADNLFPNDFSWDLRDKLTGDSISNVPMRYGVTSSYAGSSASGKFTNRCLPFILSTPWLVRPPGLLVVRIVNLATTSQGIRMNFVFAEPAKGEGL